MKKFFSFLLTLIMSVTTLQLSAQDTLTVADGTTTNSYIPVYGYYMDYYLRSQIIFPESMINDMEGASISSMTFYLAILPDEPWMSTFNVKVGSCAETTFPGNAFLNTMTQSVYTGFLTVDNDRMTITFTTPFVYSGGNLLVEFATIAASNYSASTFYGITSNNSSISGSDANSISSISPTRRNFLPKTTFVYSSSAVSCPKPNSFTATNITTNSALLTWSPGGNESSWDLYITESTTFPNASTTPTATVTDTTYSLTSLTSATTYNAYVRANCGSEHSNWKAVSFLTLCDSIFSLPFTENFDTYGTGIGAYPDCWGRINTYTVSERPYIHTTCFEGIGSLYFYAGNTGTYNIAITPPFSQSIPVNTLQADFMYRATNNTDRLIVGVMSDPTDATTFVPVDTVLPGTSITTWEERTVMFNSYTGTGRFIAFLNEYNTTSTYGYIDNLSISLIPTCPRPQYVALTNITTSGCDVSWTPMGNETAWEVVAVPAGTNVESGTPLAATAIPFTLNNLAADTQYDVYVRANCGGSFSQWSLSATFTTHPLCTPATNVSVSQITGASALVHWDYAPFGATSYNVGYSEAGQDNWTIQNVTGNHLMISGLTPMTAYDVMVLSVCSLGTADTVFAQFTTNCLAGGTLQIGNGSNTTHIIPVNNYYCYSLSEQIFLASEMNGASTIDSIAFEFAYETPSTHKNNVSIYMGHTNKSAFNNTSDYIPASDLQLVYTGNLNCHQGWNTFAFSNPFHYNGTDNLVLVVDDNSGAYDGNSYTFLVHNTGNNRAVYYYSDSYNPNPANPTSGNPISAATFNRNNVRFFIPCDNTSDCIAPNAYVSTIGENSLTITWAPGSTETSWEMQYCIDPTNWTSEGNVTSPHTISNLASDTKYTIRLRSVCGGDEYSNWTMLEERTVCSSISSLPYTEDFDDAPGSGAGNMVTCWTTGTNYSTSYPYTSSTQHHSGNFSAYFHATSTYYSYLASPQITNDINMHNLQIRFWAYKTSANYYIQVGVMTDPNDYSTFVQIGQNLSPSATSTWELFEINTNNYTGDGHYIAFRAPQNITDYIYIDDITVDLIPACQHVSNINVDPATLTPNSATLTWTAGGSESAWEVVYGLTGTISNPSTMTPLIVTGTPTITLNNLSASSTYDVFVKSICSTTEFSSWTQYSFITSCGAISALPYTENFDYMGSGSSVFPNCWVRHNTYSTSTNYPYISSTNHFSGNASLYFYNSSATYSMAVLPAIDVTAYPINTLQVSFQMRSTSSISSGIQVGIMTNASDPTTFVPFETIHNTATGIFELMEIPLSNYTGDGTYIALKMVNPNSTYSVYLDDLVVEVTPTCKKPVNLVVSNISNTGADLSWTNNSTNNVGFNIAISNIANFNPDTCANLITTTNTNYHFSNLSPNTTYYARVRTDCGNDDHSIWSDVLSFTTPPGTPANLPYFSKFVENTEAANWGLANTTSSNKWYIAQPTNFSHKVLFVSSDSGATATYAGSACKIWAFRDLNFPAASEYEISFKWRCQGESTYDYMYAFIGDPVAVEASTNNTVTAPVGSIQLGGANHKFNLNSEWNWYYQSIDASIGSGTKRLYFVWRNDPSIQHDPAIMIDSIYIKALSCSHPENLAVSNITTTSADFSFSKGNSSDMAWEYAVCDANDYVFNATPVAITDTVFTVSNLEGNSNYVIYLRTSCGNNEYSSWTSLAFATECNSISTLPYSEDFDDYGTGAGTYPNCWSKINTYSNDRPYIHSTHYEGVGSLYFYAGNSGTYNIAIMPEFDAAININTLQANFMYRAYNTSDMLIVGVMSSVTDVSTFVPVDTVFPAANPATWVEKMVSFSSYTGDGHYIAFRNNYITNTAYAYIDNLVISIDSSLAEICDAPTNLSVSNITETGATISWTAGGEETSWNLQYMEESASTWSSIIPLTSPTYTLSGLAPSTTYDVRVQANCGENTSEWVTTSFSTEDIIPEPCETPTGLYIVMENLYDSSYTVSLHWDNDPDVEGWNVKYAMDDEDWIVVSVHNNMYKVYNLMYDHTYSFRIQAICDSTFTSAWTNTVTYSITSPGIEDHLLNSISLYPNPANDIINVQCTMNNVQVTALEVFDVYGKLINTVNVVENPTQINVSNLSAGMYFVRVTTEEGVATKSFVKR